MHHGLLLSNAMWDYFNLGLWNERFLEYLNAVASPALGGTPGGSYAPEWPGPLITTVVLVSLVGAPILAFSRPWKATHAHTLVTMSALLIAFGVVFSLRGGLGYVFSFMVTSGLRAQERVLPFLAFYALVIIWVSWQALRGDRRVLKTIVAGALVVSLIPGVVPAYRILEAKQLAALNDVATQANFQSLRNMLSSKDAAKLGMILQLPVIYWPESPLVLTFDPYQNELPYLLDNPASVTKWSYGLNHRQKGYAELVAATQINNPGLLGRVRALGYDGVLMEKSALTPKDAHSIEMELLAFGAMVIFDDSLRVLFKLPAVP